VLYILCSSCSKQQVSKSKLSKDTEINGKRSKDSLQESSTKTEGSGSTENGTNHAKSSADQFSEKDSTKATEKQNDVKIESSRQKESTTTQRPGSARPGSRKHPRMDNAVEVGVAHENSSNT
jgi:hypothetical protein